MNAQNMLAALNIRTVNRDLAIKTTGTQQGGVQDIGAVGRGKKNHALALFKTIHLDQQLIERLLTLVVAAAQTSAALTSYGIDLVDKNDGRSLRPWPLQTGRARAMRPRRRTSQRSRSRKC